MYIIVYTVLENNTRVLLFCERYQKLYLTCVSFVKLTKTIAAMIKCSTRIHLLYASTALETDEVYKQIF